MADPHAVLLVPTEDGASLQAIIAARNIAADLDESVLLVDDDGEWRVYPSGRCERLSRLGQRPPCLVSYPKRGPDTQPPWSPYAIPTMDMGYGRVLALPLWWDGELVPEGWDRARRACAEIHDFRPLCSDVLVLARFLASAGLCRVVLLDLVGGALVERAP